MCTDGHVRRLTVLTIGSEILVEAVSSCVGVIATHRQSLGELMNEHIKAISFNCVVVQDLFNLDEIRTAICAAKAARQNCFICIYSRNEWTTSSRCEVFRSGANMVTSSLQSVQELLSKLNKHVSLKDFGKDKLLCPLCSTEIPGNFLREHCGLFHCAQGSQAAVCPLCNATVDCFQEHMKVSHGPKERHHHNISVGVGILCQRRSDNRYLFVQEFCNQGFYLPAGIVEPGESPLTAAIREAEEEAGIDVTVSSLIRIKYDHHPSLENSERIILTYYGHPVDESQPVKSLPDYESVGAVWATREELGDVRLRLPEVLDILDLAESGVHWPLTAFNVNLSKELSQCQTEANQ